jgi:hypothetical protein
MAPKVKPKSDKLLARDASVRSLCQAVRMILQAQGAPAVDLYALVARVERDFAERK